MSTRRRQKQASALPNSHDNVHTDRSNNRTKSWNFPLSVT